MDKTNFRKPDERDRKIDNKDRGDLKDRQNRKLLDFDTKVTHPGGDNNKKVKTKHFNKIEDTKKNDEVRREKETVGTEVRENNKEAHKYEKRNNELPKKLKTISAVIPRNLKKEITEESGTSHLEVNRSEVTPKKQQIIIEKTDLEHNSRGLLNKDKETKPPRKPLIKTITAKDASKVFKAVTFIDQKKHAATSLEVKIPNDKVDNDKNHKLKQAGTSLEVKIHNEKFDNEKNNYLKQTGTSLEVKAPNEKGNSVKNHKLPEIYGKKSTNKSSKFLENYGKNPCDKYLQFLDSNGKNVKDKCPKILDNNGNISSDKDSKFPGNNEKDASEKYSEFLGSNAIVPSDRNKSKGRVAINKNAQIPENNDKISDQYPFSDTVDKSATPSKVAVEKKLKKKGERRKKRMKRLVTSPDMSTRVRSPATEVAKWAPSSINHLTKPYYEAWVNTTLAAISRTSKKDKLFLEKQNLLQNFQKVLNARPETPDLTYENFADERYTGRIKVRQR